MCVTCQSCVPHVTTPTVGMHAAHTRMCEYLQPEDVGTSRVGGRLDIRRGAVPLYQLYIGSVSALPATCLAHGGRHARCTFESSRREPSIVPWHMSARMSTHMSVHMAVRIEDGVPCRVGRRLEAVYNEALNGLGSDGAEQPLSESAAHRMWQCTPWCRRSWPTG